LQGESGAELDAAPPDIGFEAFSATAPPPGVVGGGGTRAAEKGAGFKKRSATDSLPQYMEQLSQRRNHR